MLDQCHVERIKNVIGALEQAASSGTPVMVALYAGMLVSLVEPILPHLIERKKQ